MCNVLYTCPSQRGPPSTLPLPDTPLPPSLPPQVCERTEADKKGGHLCLRKSDGKYMLRESAMCPDAGELPR
jgi:hypothetical protein